MGQDCLRPYTVQREGELRNVSKAALQGEDRSAALRSEKENCFFFVTQQVLKSSKVRRNRFGTICRRDFAVLGYGSKDPLEKVDALCLVCFGVFDEA
jgi:hypothetical protein